jgi:hypothetical protein
MANSTRSVIRSGNPIIRKSVSSLTTDQVKQLIQYKQAASHLAYLEEMSISVNQYYQDLSDSYIKKFTTYIKSSPLAILISSYGVLFLGFGALFLFEVLYFCKRRFRSFRMTIKVLWCSCALVTIGFSLFLNFLVPVIGSMAEIAIILEPSMLNKTFYGKLEFPTDLTKGHLYPCIFGSTLK